MKPNDTLAHFSERRLLRHFADLVRADTRHTAALLAAIAEIDARKLWAKHACPSMFAFCVERFHMSEQVAGKRIWVARKARRFPVIFEMVARGELHLSAIAKIARHLTDENHRAVLRRARRKSSRELDLLVAELAPRPDVPSRIRALPRPTGSFARRPVEPVIGPRSTRTDAGVSRGDVRRAAVSAATGPPTTDGGPVARDRNSEARPRARGEIAPLSPRRYKIEITVDQETHDKLRTLQDLLTDRFASADPAAIVSRAVDVLLDETLKRKAAISDRARAGHRADDRRTRAIPAAVRREVWRRDRGRCAFVDQRGRRCRATRCVEFHHEQPYARGGRHEAGNVTLRCRAHNQYQADLDFGLEFMRGKRGGDGGPHSARNV